MLIARFTSNRSLMANQLAMRNPIKDRKAIKIAPRASINRQKEQDRGLCEAKDVK
jgi:hypothetical protein